MSRFDEMIGLSGGLTRRPLKTLAEFGGGAKSSTAATTDYGPTPPKTKKGDPNSAYRKTPDPKIGGATPFPTTKRQKRTGTPASPRQLIPVRTEDEDED
jgi:hypothetical protein